MFSPIFFHMLLKTSVLPVKWTPPSSGESSSALRDLARIAGHEVDDAGRQAGRLEHLERVVAAQHRGRRRLPDDGVAHQRRRGRQVAADRGEVERRDRVDEAFERAVLHLVPHAGAADRLLAVELLREVGVEAPEVDHLGRGVDLGLERRLRLAEHRRGVDRRRARTWRAARRRAAARAARSSHGQLPHSRRASAAAAIACCDVLGPGQVVVGQHVLVVVRHHRLRRACPVRISRPPMTSGMSIFSAAIVFRRAFSSARSGEPGAYESVRIVDRRRHAADAAERGNRRRARRWSATAWIRPPRAWWLESSRLVRTWWFARRQGTKRSFYSTRLADELHDDFARARARVELEQHDLLPGAEGQTRRRRTGSSATVRSGRPARDWIRCRRPSAGDGGTRRRAGRADRGGR